MGEILFLKIYQMIEVILFLISCPAHVLCEVT